MQKERESKLTKPLARAKAFLSPARIALELKSDARLLELFTAGREGAFAVIKDRYRGLLVAYVERMVGATRNEAEAIVKDVLDRSHTGLRGQSHAQALKPWLYRAVHERCSALLRAGGTPASTVAAEGEPTADPYSSSSLLFKRRARSRELAAKVAALPEQQRSVLLLRELHGLSHDQIAFVVGISTELSAEHLVQARTALLESGEANEAVCAEFRKELVVAADQKVRLSEQSRRHLWGCAECRRYDKGLHRLDSRLKLLLPSVGIGLFSFVPKAFAVGKSSGGGATGARGLAGLSTGKLVATLACAVVAVVGAVEIVKELSGSKETIGADQSKLAFSLPKPTPVPTPVDGGKTESEGDGQQQSDTSNSGSGSSGGATPSIDNTGSSSSPNTGSFGGTDGGSSIDSGSFNNYSGGGTSVPVVPRDRPGEQITVQGPTKSPYTIPGGELLVGRSIDKGAFLSGRVALVTRKLPLLAGQAGQEKHTEFSCPGGMVVRSVFSNSTKARVARTHRLELKRISDYGASDSGDVIYTPASGLNHDTSIVAGVVCMLPPNIKPNERLDVNHFRVCSDALFVYSQRDGKDTAGLLVKGDGFDVINYDNGDQRIYGFAQGDTKDYGWVPLGGLCGSGNKGYSPTAQIASNFERRQVCSPSRTLRKTPGTGESTGESVYSGNIVRVMRYAASFAYVYSFKVNKFGWIPRTALCKQLPPAADAVTP